MNESKRCCFTGHRANKLPWGHNENDPGCLEFKKTLTDVLDALYESGYRHFICGMALGTDMYFGEAVVALRTRRPDVTLEAAVPCPEQEKHWSAQLKDRYRSLLAAADKMTVICPHYTSYCMNARNRYMVDNADLLLAAYQGGPGGTKNTLSYAAKKNLRIIQLPVVG